MNSDGLDGTWNLWQIMHETIHRGVFVCGGRMLHLTISMSECNARFDVFDSLVLRIYILRRGEG